jgi:5'-nucleotidase
MRKLGLALFILLAASLSADGITAEGPQQFTLTILHNNDAESRLLNAGPGLDDYGGVARFATLVRQLRAEAAAETGPAGSLLLSAGDTFIAGPHFQASVDKGAPYDDAVAIGLIGYDAVAIGNHDFDFGPEGFSDFIRSFALAGLPAPRFLSANLDVGGEPSLQAHVQDQVILKSTVIEMGSDRIGIVGATTPTLPFISSPRNVKVDPEVAAAVQREVDKLTTGGVNKIVVVSHLEDVDEDISLAALLSGVDVIIAAGGHELLANADDVLVPGDVRDPARPYPLLAEGADNNPVLVTTTSGGYRYVGRLVVRFDEKGRVIYVDPKSGPVRVTGGLLPDAVTADADILARAVTPVAAYVNELGSDVIGDSQVALEGRSGPPAIPGLRTGETNLGNLAADAMLWQARQLAAEFGAPSPHIALQNAGGIRNDSLIPAGPITALTTFNIAPFANFVSVVEAVPPGQLKEIMENAVSRVAAFDARFAQIAGFSFVFDPFGQAQVLDLQGNVTTPGRRVREIRLDDGTFIVRDGTVVAGAPSVDVATLDFLARGGDQYPFRGRPFTNLGVTYQQALSAYITQALQGLITAADYPYGGKERIQTQ